MGTDMTKKYACGWNWSKNVKSDRGADINGQYFNFRAPKMAILDRTSHLYVHNMISLTCTWKDLRQTCGLFGNRWYNCNKWRCLFSSKVWEFKGKKAELRSIEGSHMYLQPIGVNKVMRFVMVTVGVKSVVLPRAELSRTWVLGYSALHLGLNTSFFCAGHVRCSQPNKAIILSYQFDHCCSSTSPLHSPDHKMC